MKKKKVISKKLIFFTLLLLCVFFTGCKTIPKPQKTHELLYLTTTGYCPCQKCTGWKRNWKLQPVYAYGHLKGKKKEVGITSDGTKVKKGIIAADINYFPYGTLFYIPGYGYGEVHDKGSTIKGKYHLDLFFPSHNDALKWGRRNLTVKYWKK